VRSLVNTLEGLIDAGREQKQLRSQVGENLEHAGKAGDTAGGFDEVVDQLHRRKTIKRRFIGGDADDAFRNSATKSGRPTEVIAIHVPTLPRCLTMSTISGDKDHFWRLCFTKYK
jgi:hypothetical protein